MQQRCHIIHSSYIGIPFTFYQNQNKNSIPLHFKPGNTLGQRLVHLKDKTARHKQSHVIYAIQCNEECSDLCISETKQPLHRCMAQERRDNSSRQYSAVHLLSIITEQKQRLQTQVASCLPCCPVISSQKISQLYTQDGQDDYFNNTNDRQQQLMADIRDSQLIYNWSSNLDNSFSKIHVIKKNTLHLNKWDLQLMRAHMWKESVQKQKLLQDAAHSRVETSSRSQLHSVMWILLWMCSSYWYQPRKYFTFAFSFKSNTEANHR